MYILDQFIETVKRICNLPEEEIKKLSLHSKEHKVSKGYYFIRAGQIPRKFAFVSRGLFRYFYSHKDGREFTKGFMPENSFITSYSAMKTETETYYNIQALEDSVIATIDYDKWKQLVLNYQGWNSFLIALLEKGYLKKEKRERELLLFSAKERYQSFLSEYPDLEKRIKQHMIASYLGITPVALSRVRKNMGIINIG